MWPLFPLCLHLSFIVLVILVSFHGSDLGMFVIIRPFSRVLQYIVDFEYFFEMFLVRPFVNVGVIFFGKLEKGFLEVCFICGRVTLEYLIVIHLGIVERRLCLGSWFFLFLRLRCSCCEIPIRNLSKSRFFINWIIDLWAKQLRC